MNHQTWGGLKPALVGTFCGLAAFAAMTWARAAGPLGVADVRSNPKAYVGQTVSVTGIGKELRSTSVSRAGALVPYYVLDLYEVDGKGRQGSHYILVKLPASDFTNVPREGDTMTISGPMKWPYQIAVIEE